MLDGIAGKHRIRATRAQPHHHVAGRVPGRAVEPNAVFDLMVGLDQHGLACFDHGQHAVPIGSVSAADTRCQCSNLVRAKTYRALGKVGIQWPSTSRVFQLTWSTCK